MKTSTKLKVSGLAVAIVGILAPTEVMIKVIAIIGGGFVFVLGYIVEGDQ